MIKLCCVALLSCGAAAFHQAAPHMRRTPAAALGTWRQMPAQMTATIEPASRVQERNATVEAMVGSVTESLVDDTCNVDKPSVDCADLPQRRRMTERLRRLVRATARSVDNVEFEEADGDVLEAGWEEKGRRSSLRRNVEVWTKLASCAIKVLKARKSGNTEDKTAAAVYARDSLLQLGPTFVKLGQVLSTRTDVLPKEYTDVLKSLQDDVPAFSGAKAIVDREIGTDVFATFDDQPIKAASLGQVHRATLKNGQQVAVKVQRAGLKELFDVDLKNLRKLCELLDKVDPKSDGADRSYIDVFDESEKLLYEEIDYLNEARNADRFREENKGVRVPMIYYEYSTPRVLSMEFVESFKLTDIARVEEYGLDRQDLARKVADSFLYQVIDTGYFHCDPHPGNLAVDETGTLVYYDFGMMDELKPNVRSGFQKFCFALFDGGPYVSELVLNQKAKELVDAVEEMGVLAKGADRLACEQLARYFLKTFKQAQLGIKGTSIKQTLGAELQALTESQVFRFPSTFTFIFRAVASIEGIGKTLDSNYDLGKFAQPFVERLLDTVNYGGDPVIKQLSIASKATGLNVKDVETALSSPRKIAYLEQTLRSMEQGNLKIRVRSLENEQALARLSTQTSALTNLLLSTLFLNAFQVADALKVVKISSAALAGIFGFKGVKNFLDLAAADKKRAKYETKQFNDGN